MRTTFMAKPGSVQRDWYVIDAEGKTLGRLATEAASLLRGKHKPEFTPHIDTGDFVIVINCAKVVLTGKKLEQKNYYRHSLYPGGLKTTKAKDMLKTKPELMVFQAIKGMVPHTKLGAAQMKKLRVYAGAEHEQQAQQPKTWELNS
ncbi:50S ribosomal protein L13 [Desulfuribacillus stibiiarsenatis]|uniref:Large ribosomal subunit protein uL13 n=1 Tax=Desulfuribacillus stibiiarsenatis TaxID=1390249 RepID=A0A1E5L884_9FIRM|nr:50S ribosomal protein L13 [Desulfuribacillus stibiiarsenatis]OEH86360.1 50S ribosomal protein L13 [Desulfuribacillus stibiiarsenatis]